MQTQCAEKKHSYAEKQQLRSEEIAAIGQAIAILQSPESMGNAEKHLSLAQESTSGVALSQLRGTDTLESDGDRNKVQHFLYSEAARLNSRHLSLLANKIRADPFVKVKRMIEGMTSKLLNEANADAEQNGFCTEELGKSKLTRTKLTEDMDSLKADIQEGSASIMQLAEDTKTLSKEVADLAASMTEATSNRVAEKAANKETIVDSKAAQGAVARATAVLREFYTKSSTATALMQSSKYNGQQDEAGGVLAMLEVIASDFATLETKTNAAEETAAKEYKALKVESQKNSATKMKTLEMNKADKAAAERQVQSSTNDMKGTETQLLAAERYFKDLMPKCVEKGQSHEKKMAARAAEMQSLKEALEILPAL